MSGSCLIYNLTLSLSCKPSVFLVQSETVQETMGALGPRKSKIVLIILSYQRPINRFLPFLSFFLRHLLLSCSAACFSIDVAMLLLCCDVAAVLLMLLLSVLGRAYLIEVFFLDG